MARGRAEKAVFTFHTTTMAMRMERSAKKSGSPGRLIPIPRQISAGCDMAWSVPAGDGETLETLIREAGIEIKGTYSFFL